MTEMVLNHASQPVSGASELPDWLSGLAAGMAALVNAQIAGKTLRMSGAAANTWFEVCQPLRQADRDGYNFLSRLAAKVPVTDGLLPATADRLLSCESLGLSATDGEPLLLCAIQDWIAVSFPSAVEWDRNRLMIVFQELVPDGTLQRAEEHVDNLARSLHADAILERDRERRRAGSTPDELWAQRGTMFPSLLFGPGVARNLKAHSALLRQIVGKLTSLDEVAGDWTTGPAPDWGNKVSPEAPNLMKQPKLHDARLFESVLGGRRMFEWHARVGDSFRIHLRFDATDRSVEIGYIGPKLAT